MVFLDCCRKRLFLTPTSFFILGTKCFQNVIFQNKTIFALKEKLLKPRTFRGFFCLSLNVAQPCFPLRVNNNVPINAFFAIIPKCSCIELNQKRKFVALHIFPYTFSSCYTQCSSHFLRLICCETSEILCLI